MDRKEDEAAEAAELSVELNRKKSCCRLGGSGDEGQEAAGPRRRSLETRGPAEEEEMRETGVGFVLGRRDDRDVGAAEVRGRRLRPSRSAGTPRPNITPEKRRGRRRKGGSRPG